MNISVKLFSLTRNQVRILSKAVAVFCQLCLFFGHNLNIHDVKSVTEGIFPWEGVCEPFSADNESEYLPVFFPCQGVVL